jgi:hypothetical protein
MITNIRALELAEPKRTDAGVAEDLYMSDEKTIPVLRGEIDQLEKELNKAIIEIKELSIKVDTNHREHNKRYHGVDRKMVVLLGDGELSDGLVRQHKAALGRVWEKFKEQSTRIDEGKEDTWKLKLAMVVASMSTGGGVVYGLMRLLGA